MKFQRLLCLMPLLIGSTTASAQTSDDLFDDSVVHEIRLTMAASLRLGPSSELAASR